MQDIRERAGVVFFFAGGPRTLDCGNSPADRIIKLNERSVGWGGDSGWILT